MIEWVKLSSNQISQLNRNLPVIVPLGLVEAHGPHLAVSVDVDSANYFAREAAERSGAILAPALPFGFADEMREYPGTLGLSATTFMEVIADLCFAFCQQGFKKVIFITGHGANKGPCELAFYQVWEKYPDFKSVCWNWWSDCGISGIHHADKGETEVALFIGTPSFMQEVKDFTLQKPWYKIRSRFQLDPASGGINGHPGEANKKNGELLVKKALDALTERIKSTIND